MAKNYIFKIDDQTRVAAAFYAISFQNGQYIRPDLIALDGFDQALSGAGVTYNLETDSISFTKSLPRNLTRNVEQAIGTIKALDNALSQPDAQVEIVTSFSVFKEA